MPQVVGESPLKISDAIQKDKFSSFCSFLPKTRYYNDHRILVAFAHNLSRAPVHEKNSFVHEAEIYVRCPYTHHTIVMAYFMQTLTSKKDVDYVIKNTLDKVLVLRFGREEDPETMKLDDTVSITRVFNTNLI
jgi:hypothetical protein